jgi:hypothetical protein
MELFEFVGEGDASAEERIKSLLGDTSQVMRRRIVRRPLSGSSYISPPLGFGERDGSNSSTANADPLSELLAHLTASRRGHEPPGRDHDSTSSLSNLAHLALEETSERHFGAQLDTPSAADSELRRRFLQELLLATISEPAAAVFDEPLVANRGDGVELHAPAPNVQQQPSFA